MHYAVPTEFHKRGLLRRLLTDLHLPGEHWSRVDPRTKRYRIPNVPRKLIRASNMQGLLARGVRNSVRGLRSSSLARIIDERTLTSLIRQESQVAQIDAVYAFDTAAAAVFRESGNAYHVLEQCIATRRLQQELYSAFQRKGWVSASKYRDRTLSQLADIEAEEHERAHQILCPSQFVADSLIRSGALPGKIKVVPYGFSQPSDLPRVVKENKEPVVFFAGQVGFRKGAHAIREISRALPRVSFKLAGNVSPEVKRLSFPGNVKLLGPISFPQMCVEFQCASLFFLPSWLEGSATSIYEAMSFGLPVVTTPNSGSVLTDGLEGYVCQPDDYQAMLRSVSSILDSKSLRERMSDAALQTSRNYTVEGYGSRLMEVVGADENRKAA